MSKETPVQSVTTLNEESDNQESSKRPNVVVRAARAMKREPKTTLAVAAGFALVAGSAFLGRKTAPLHIQVVDSEIEVEPVLQTPDSDDSVA